MGNTCATCCGKTDVNEVNMGQKSTNDKIGASNTDGGTYKQNQKIAKTSTAQQHNTN